MAATTGAMLALQGGSTLLSYLQQRGGASAAERQGAYEAGMLERNAEFAEAQGADAIARGSEASMRVRREARLTSASQRAALAASGIDVTVGSAVDLQAETETLGELDALTIANNARKQAWGFSVEAADLRERARLTRKSAKATARDLRWGSISTLLTGAAGLYDTYRARPRGPKSAPRRSGGG